MSEQQGTEEPAPSPTTGQTKWHPSRVPYEVAIVTAAFFICTIYAGTLSISGLYLKYFLDTFEADKLTTTGVITVQASLTYFSGVVAGPLVVRFGTRKVAVAGSLSASVGIFLSGFAFNIVWLYIFYGAFTGFGFGVLMIASGVSVQEHTNKRRALAGSLALCGMGFGTLVMPQIAESAIREYGERGSLFILGGVMLNTLPCALVLRSRLTMDNKKVNMIHLKLLEKQRRESLNPLLNQNNIICDSSSGSKTGVANIAYREGAYENLRVTHPLGKISSKSSTKDIRNEASLKTGSFAYEGKPKTDSLSTIPEVEDVNSSKVNIDLQEESNRQPKSENNVDKPSPEAVQILSIHHANVAGSAGCSLGAGYNQSTISLQSSPAQTKEVKNTPTHAGWQAKDRRVHWNPPCDSQDRTNDSFVSQNLALSVVNLTDVIVKVSVDSGATDPLPRLHKRRESLKEVMAPVSLDNGSNEFTIGMALIIGAFFFLAGGLFSAYVFSPLKALRIGLGSTEGATLLSLAGIGEVGGRLVGTFLGPCHDKLPIVIYIICLLTMGISCAFIGICRTYTEMMVALMIYGVSNGMDSVVSTTMMRDIIGVRHFALIYGYASAMGGIGNIFCMQISTLIWEKTSDISIPFIIAGGFLATAVLIFLAAFMTSVHAQRKTQRRTISDDTEAISHMNEARF